MRAGKIITSLFCFCYQYHFVLSCIQLRYCDLTTSSPSGINFPSHVLSYYKLYASETNSHCCCVYYIYGTILTILNQQNHIVTDAIKYNLMNLLKILTCCCFVWKCDDILVVKWAQHWLISEICYNLIARFLLSCKTMNPVFF